MSEGGRLVHGNNVFVWCWWVLCLCPVRSFTCHSFFLGASTVDAVLCDCCLLPASVPLLPPCRRGPQVYIALKELLPTAHRYDPEDKVVTISLIGGMIIMAASLVLFLF